MTVPSVQNAMVRTPLTVPAAASTPELVALVQQLDAAVVEERAQPQQRIARVERLGGRLGGHDRHSILLCTSDFRLPLGNQYFPKASATLCPPNPNELLIAYW